jgi:hypothetical protein
MQDEILADSGYESCYGETEEGRYLKDLKGKGKAVDRGHSPAQGYKLSGEVSDEERCDSIQIAEAGSTIIAVDEVKLGIGQKRKHEQGEVEKGTRLASKRNRAHAPNKLGMVKDIRKSTRLHKT